MDSVKQEVELEITESGLQICGHPIYVSSTHRDILIEEYIKTGGKKGALSQFVEMLKLPGLIGAVGLPDIHEGYAFPIGSVAAVNLEDPKASISPEGVGYDINCGVQSIGTTLSIEEIVERKEELADALFEAIPSGIGGNKPECTLGELNKILECGLESLVEAGKIQKDSLEYTESRGSLPGNSRIVPQAAKGRGLRQLCSLGSGNHYLEIQKVKEIYDIQAASAFRIKEDQVVISIHTGSRGLGYEIWKQFEKSHSNKTLPWSSPEAQKYITLMNSAANFAWANRALIGERVKSVFDRLFPDSDFFLIYDVSHNIAKVEDNNTLVHRKGSSRALPPLHPELSSRYAEVGQPVPVGGSMGTCSYLLAGSKASASLSWYSTCHGAGRLISRSIAKDTLKYDEIIDEMKSKGIVVRSSSNSGIVEEAPCCYKDVKEVVGASESTGLTSTVAMLEPVIVIKG